jgi:hypothetical protein
VLVLESVARLVSSLAPIEEIPVGTGETR